MPNKYIVRYSVGKQVYRGIKTFQILVEASNKSQAIEIAEMQLKYGQKFHKKHHIVSVELDNS